MCYHVGMLSPSTWGDAKARCLMQGGRLAQPHSPEMARALVSSFCNQGTCWIGMHDQNRDGVMEFSNGSRLHPAASGGWWHDAPTEPGSCALLTPYFDSGGGAVQTQACSAVHGYLCEKRADLFAPLFVVGETLVTTLLVLVLSFATVIVVSVSLERVNYFISGFTWPLFCFASGALVALVSFVFVGGQTLWFWLRLAPMVAVTHSLRALHRALAGCMPGAAARARLQREREQRMAPPSATSDDSSSAGEEEAEGAGADAAVSPGGTPDATAGAHVPSESDNHPQTSSSSSAVSPGAAGSESAGSTGAVRGAVRGGPAAEDQGGDSDQDTEVRAENDAQHDAVENGSDGSGSESDVDPPPPVCHRCACSG